jgi:hypothetical protein
LNKSLRFSDRIGVTETPALLLLDTISPELHASLWNCIYARLSSYREGIGWERLAVATARGFKKMPVDDLPIRSYQKKDWLRKYYDSLQWYEVYNFIEFAVWHTSSSTPSLDSSLLQAFNAVLERERSGYRFIEDVLTPIAEASELAEVQGAMRATAAGPLAGAHAHLSAAVALFSQRPEPDYRNATKEAISAIESIARLLGKENAQGLAGALGELNKKAPIHRSLYQAFCSLYGYASNEHGIRHAILDDGERVGFDEAKYMIVSCSAFMNYLISKADAAGLLAGK